MQRVVSDTLALKSTDHVFFISMEIKYVDSTQLLISICTHAQYGVQVKERPLNKHCLDTTDVFILDVGMVIYQWNGKTCNKDERYKAAQYLQHLKV